MSLGDGFEDGVDEVGDHLVVHEFDAEFPLFVEGIKDVEFCGGVGVLANREVEAQGVVFFEFTGSELVCTGSRFGRDACLEATVVRQTDQNGRLKSKSF